MTTIPSTPESRTTTAETLFADRLGLILTALDSLSVQYTSDSRALSGAHSRNLQGEPSQNEAARDTEVATLYELYENGDGPATEEELNGTIDEVDQRYDQISEEHSKAVAARRAERDALRNQYNERMAPLRKELSSMYESLARSNQEKETKDLMKNVVEMYSELPADPTDEDEDEEWKEERSGLYQETVYSRGGRNGMMMVDLAEVDESYWVERDKLWTMSAQQEWMGRRDEVGC